MSRTVYRLWWGEVATEEAIIQFTRMVLLYEADHLYPEMRREIEEAAKWWPFRGAPIASLAELDVIAERYDEVREWVDTFNAHWEEPKLHEAQLWMGTKPWVLDFCRRWGLVSGRDVPQWAVEMVVRTVGRTQLSGGWAGWFVPTRLALSGDGYYHPQTEPLKQAKRRVPRSRWHELSAAVEDALANGFTQVRSRHNPTVVTWAVRHQFGGELWRAIGKGLNRRFPKEQGDAIRKQARELLQLAGLSRPAGRPKRS